MAMGPGRREKPMSLGLGTMVGCRVRLVRGSSVEGYQPGDEGTVMLGPRPFSGEGGYYLVRMDRDDPDAVSVLLAEEEIETVG